MPMLTAAQNVELPLLLTTLRRKERASRVHTALSVVGLADRVKHHPREMSGGQQQRVAIARAFVSDPNLLLCDEPTGDLDRHSADEILSILQLLNKDLGKTIVMVTHDPAAARYAKRILHLDKGQFVEREFGRVNDFDLVRKNLFRRKLRAILMIVSILVAFMIFGVLAGFYRAFSAGEDRAAADRLITVNKINFTQPLPIAYFNRVRAVDGVRQVTHANWFGGYYQDPKNFLMSLAVEPVTYFDVYRNEFDIPPAQLKAFIQDRGSAVIGETLANKWGWKVGDRVPVASNLFSQRSGGHTWDFTIAGIVKGKVDHVDTNFMLFQYAYFDETRSFGKDTIGWLILQTNNPENNDRVVKTIDSMFANLHRRDLDRHRKGFRQGICGAVRQYRADRVSGRRGRFRHHPDDRRQHHGALDPRTHKGDRRAEDARVLRRADSAHGARRIGTAGVAWRSAGSGGRCPDHDGAAIQPCQYCAGVRRFAADCAGRHRADARARLHHRDHSGSQCHAAENRHRARTRIGSCVRSGFR